MIGAFALVAIGMMLTLLIQIVVDTFFRRRRNPWPKERAARFSRAQARQLKKARATLTERLMNREVHR